MAFILLSFDNLQESSKKLEQFVLDQRDYSQQYQKSTVWLQQGMERIQSCQEGLGGMSDIESQLEIAKVPFISDTQHLV